MSSATVLVLVPRIGRDVDSTVDAVKTYLQTTGFDFEVRVQEDARRVATESQSKIVVIVDPDLPYPVSAIGDAVALIESGAADVVFGSASPERRADPLLRWLLVPELPDPRLHLKAFSADAVRVLLTESKLNGVGMELEIGYLANKYGFRIERLSVNATGRAARSYGLLGGIAAAISIRLNDRRNGYRAPRRCPVCFSSEVYSWAQIPGNVVRACSRCKCRYLNTFAETEESTPVRRILRPQPAASDAVTDPLDDTAHARSAREKTSRRRLAALRRQVPSRGRVLEIGVRDGSFGAATSREYEYVGIDRAAAAARAARGRGLEVYCSTLTGFVNTGPAFDAVTLFHVFESMADPHDALARIKDLLKPGGVLLISAFDTEGLAYLVSDRKRAVLDFRTRVILYSRSALIELLERSGFEIASVAPEFAYRDHKFIRHRIASRWPAVGSFVKMALKGLPDPLLVGSGSIRIVAKRRAGTPVNVRAIRSVEPTHAR